MKTILYFFSSFLLFLFIITSSYAQTIETGIIGISIDDYGRLRVLSPDLSTRQIDRSSILIGGDTGQLFTYKIDAESVDTARNVEPATMGNYELYVKIDNSFSGEKPDVEIAMNVYGWMDENFVIIKQSIKNTDTEIKTLNPGMEILPQVDGAYGFDIIQLSNSGLIKVDAGDGTTKTGYKYLSHSLTRLNPIDWFDGYDSNKVNFYNWFMNNNITERFEAGSDGAVAMMGTESVTLNAGESVDIFLAVAVASDSVLLETTMNSAVERYNSEINVESQAIMVDVNDLGRIRVFSPDFDTRQIDRSSILIAGSENEIFDYSNDAESVDTVRTVTPATKGDSETYVKFDNSYSGLKPDVEVSFNIYSWMEEGYVIVKQIITNKDTESRTLHPGMEILPQVDGAYGFDIVVFSPMEMVKINAGDGTTNTGYKYLSSSLVGLNSIEWFEGYSANDADLYGWFMNDNITQRFEAGSAGAVAMMRSESVTLAPDETLEVYLAIAVGADSSKLVANMSKAIQKYEGEIVSVELVDNKVPSNFILENNYPNPFNPSTVIEFSIPSNEFVNLSVYNVLGQKVSELVNSQVSAGTYSYNFDASNFSSGIYYYTLNTGNFSSTKKMMLVK